MSTVDSNTTQLDRDLSGLKVLVVDDSKTILRTAEALLSEYDCWVATAQDGFEALPKIAVFKPDVIFVDIMMPRLDGYQTCALIKANKNYRNVPVVMLSSKDGIFDLARGRLAGSDKYLTKPFTRQDLLSAIDQHVLSKREQEQATPDINLLDEDAANTVQPDGLPAIDDLSDGLEQPEAALESSGNDELLDLEFPKD